MHLISFIYNKITLLNIVNPLVRIILILFLVNFYLKKQDLFTGLAVSIYANLKTISTRNNTNYYYITILKHIELYSYYSYILAATFNLVPENKQIW